MFGDDKLVRYHPCEHIIKDTNHCEVHGLPNPLGWGPVHGHLEPDQIFHTGQYRTLQTDMVNGVKNPACYYCWELEDEEQVYNDGRKAKTSPRLDPPLIDRETKEGYLLHFILDNKCNMGCRMCTPIVSNRLYKDYDYFKKNDIDIEQISNGWFVNGSTGKPLESNQWEWVLDNADKIGALKITGGEPFFNNMFLSSLELFDKSNINFGVTTNCSLISNKIVNLLNEFKGLYVTVSVDSVDKNYQYIRHPVKFEKFEKSFNNLLRCNNIKELQFNCVVSALNFLHLDELLLWSKPYHAKLHFCEVYPVRGTSIKYLPSHILNMMKEKLNVIDMADAHLLRDMIGRAIKDNQPNRQKILQEITLFDKSRNQKFENFLHPVLVKWLQQS